MYFLNVRILFTILLLFGTFFTFKIAAQEAPLHIAVASNFRSTLVLLVESYTKSNPGKIIISSASTGKLATQIRYGAPYNIFLAADRARPELLLKEGLAYENSYYIYAQGQLALISQRFNAESALALLQSGQIKQLSIANAKTAPYGEVAKSWLSDQNFTESSFQYITGENINQTWQFFQQGGTDAALVAMSQILLVSDDSYRFWLLPQSVNQQLQQAAVVLKSTVNRKASDQFMTYLRSTEAVDIIKKAGYRIIR